MTVYLQDTDLTLHHGDCLEVLRSLPDRSVHMCATSPPFYGLRDYGTGEWEGGDPDCEHAPRKFVDGCVGCGIAMEDATPGCRRCDDRHLKRSIRDTPAGRSYSDPDPARPELPNPPSGWAERDATVKARDPVCRCGARRVDRQIGLEETPDQWVERLVAVFREVRRVLRDDGTLWVEIGDSYASTQATGGGYSDKSTLAGFTNANTKGRQMAQATPSARLTTNCKQKDLLGQPWLLAFALRADGWYLRSEIIWARPNPMPESVTDRPTKSHSTVFLLSKRPRYFYDADAIREKASPNTHSRGNGTSPKMDAKAASGHGHEGWGASTTAILATANARSVWNIPTEPTPFAHFATWPRKLVARMILAGTSERGCCPECGAPWVRDVESERLRPAAPSGNREVERWNQESSLGGRRVVRDVGWSPSCECRIRTTDADGCDESYSYQPVPCTVLDPFAGSGTTLLVARQHGRHSIGIELNPAYCELVRDRTSQQSLLADLA